MALQIFCAVDLGAESGRVVAGFFDGSELRLEELHRFANVPAQLGSQLIWDAPRLWNDVLDGLTRARELGDLAGIGVDTWGVDFGLIDEAGRLIANPTHYRDERHAGFAERAAAIMPEAELYARTGIGTMAFNTLFQLMAVREGARYQIEAAHRLLFMPDLFHFWLSGEAANEYSIASTSQLLDARTRDFDRDLLERFDLPARLVSTPVSPGTPLGQLRPEVARRTGLASGTQVIAPGCHDTASAIAATPLRDRRQNAFLSSGTWSLLGLEVAEPVLSEEARIHGFTNEGGADGTIRLLKNIAGLWLMQECRRHWAGQGQSFSYDELTRLAAAARPHGPIIDPDDARFSAPGDMPARIQDFCRETGQAQPSSPGEFVRCCLDSLALRYRWTCQKLEALTGARLTALHAVGGGTRNELLCQLSADCLDLPVHAGPVEGTAAGNILIQALGTGALSNLDDIREIVRGSFEVRVYEPTADTKTLWDERFGAFNALISSRG